MDDWNNEAREYLVQSRQQGQYQRRRHQELALGVSNAYPNPGDIIEIHWVIPPRLGGNYELRINDNRYRVEGTGTLVIQVGAAPLSISLVRDGQAPLVTRVVEPQVIVPDIRNFAVPENAILNEQFEINWHVENTISITVQIDENGVDPRRIELADRQGRTSVALNRRGVSRVTLLARSQHWRFTEAATVSASREVSVDIRRPIVDIIHPSAVIYWGDDCSVVIRALHTQALDVFIDARPLATGVAPPYETVLPDLALGEHELTVIASGEERVGIARRFSVDPHPTAFSVDDTQPAFFGLSTVSWRSNIPRGVVLRINGVEEDVEDRGTRRIEVETVPIIVDLLRRIDGERIGNIRIVPQPIIPVIRYFALPESVFVDEPLVISWGVADTVEILLEEIIAGEPVRIRILEGQDGRIEIENTHTGERTFRLSVKSAHAAHSAMSNVVSRPTCCIVRHRPPRVSLNIPPSVLMGSPIEVSWHADHANDVMLHWSRNGEAEETIAVGQQGVMPVAVEVYGHADFRVVATGPGGVAMATGRCAMIARDVLITAPNEVTAFYCHPLEIPITVSYAASVRGILGAQTFNIRNNMINVINPMDDFTFTIEARGHDNRLYRHDIEVSVHTLVVPDISSDFAALNALVVQLPR